MTHSTKKKYFVSRCIADGCTNDRRRGAPHCAMHERRLRRNGHYGLQHRPNRRPDGSGAVTAAGYVSLNNGGNRKYEHVLVAERMYGGQLPSGAQVHHINGLTADNREENLMIFMTDAEHKLWHQRERAKQACGDPDYRKCWVCKQYDDPANLRIRANQRGRETVVHLACEREKNNARWPARKAQRAAGRAAE